MFFYIKARDARHIAALPKIGLVAFYVKTRGACHSVATWLPI